MEKLIKKIKSIKEFNLFMDRLIMQVKDNKPISDNAMIDGLIIGFLLYRQNVIFDILFLNKNVGRLLDGTIQQIEQSTIWLINNEDKLLEI